MTVAASNTQTFAQTSAAATAARENAPEAPPAAFEQTPEEHQAFETFLDMLIIAESGGVDTAKNPRSSALGPYQFIRSTFLYVARRHLAGETSSLSNAQLLARRTDRVFSRKVAAAYLNENAIILDAANLPATFANLRLTFLLGPTGALRVLTAKKTSPLNAILAPETIRANPFMSRMTVADIIARARREVINDPSAVVRIDPKYRRAGSRANGVNRPKGPKIAVKWNLSKPSCRRWLALKKQRLARSQSGQ